MSTIPFNYKHRHDITHVGLWISAYSDILDLSLNGDIWSLSVVLPCGKHQYKFKIKTYSNEYWELDSNNHNTEQHEYNQNSVIYVDKNYHDTSIRLFPNNNGMCFLNTALQLLLSCKKWVKQLNETHWKKPFAQALSELLNGGFVNDFLSKISYTSCNLNGELHDKDTQRVLSRIFRNLRQEDSDISQFLFQTKTRTHCVNCKKVSNWETNERYIQPIFIVQPHSINTQKLIEKALYDNYCKCEHCNGDIYLEKSFIKIGNYLIISILGTLNNATLDQTIQISVDGITKHLSLIAVNQYFSNQTGNMGHYRGFIMSQQQWWLVDDMFAFLSKNLPSSQVKHLVYELK